MTFDPCAMAVVPDSIFVCDAGILTIKRYLQVTFGTPDTYQGPLLLKLLTAALFFSNYILS